MIIEGRGENPSNTNATDYREMCQIHETVVNKQLLGICIPAPTLPIFWCHEVQLGPPFHTRRGSG